MINKNLKNIMIILFFLLLTMPIVNAQVENIVLSLTLKYDNGKLKQEGITLIQGSPPDRRNQLITGYTAKVISFNKEVLYSFKFSIELIPLSALDPSWFDEEGNQIYFPKEKVKPLKELTFVLNFPYFKNVKYIEIYDPNNKLILTVDVSEYAICNQNKICDGKESNEICPEDCPLSINKEKISFWKRLIIWIKSIFM